MELASIKKALHELQALAAARGDIVPVPVRVSMAAKQGGDKGSAEMKTESQHDQEEVKSESKAASMPARIKLNKGEILRINS